MTARHPRAHRADGRNLVERFLGPESARGGPFALLGLRPDDAIARKRVIHALEQSLARVDDHVLSETPEADEVRLALHAAAAQLLNPTVLEHLLHRWAPDAASARVRARQSAEPLDPISSLEQDAVLTFALCGGWNARSLRRLAMLAHARGLPSQEVGRALRRITRMRPRPRRPVPVARPAHAGAAPPKSAPRGGAPKGGAPRGGAPARPRDILAPDPGTDPRDPIVTRLRLAGLLGAVAVATIVLLVVAVRLIVSASEPSPRIGGPGGARADGAGPAPVEAAPPDAPDAIPERRTELRNPALVLRELRAAVDGADIAPAESLDRFASAVEVLSRVWPTFSADQLRSANDQVGAFVRRVSSERRRSRIAVDAVGRGSRVLGLGAHLVGADDVWPAVWSASVLSVLSHDQNMSATAAEFIRADLSDVRGADAPRPASFPAAAVATLRKAARESIVDTPEAWVRWIEAIEAVTPEGSQSRQATLLAGLERLIAQDGADRPPVEVEIRVVALAIDWRESELARRWLVRQFDDRRATTPGLSVLTAVLAERSAVPGVDVTMVLSADATPADRQQLRDRYRGVWRLDAPRNADAFVSLLLTAVDEQPRRAADAGWAETLAETVTVASINAAAMRYWRGDHDEAERLLLERRVRVDALMSTDRTGRGRTVRAAGDGAWAVAYLGGADSPAAQVEQLQRVAGASSIGPVDAGVVVNEAIRGSPRRVRDAARTAVTRHANAPAMVNAVLEELPDAPSNDQVVRLVAAVTMTNPLDPDADRWKIDARRLLVARLIEMLAAEGDAGVIDELAELLREVYGAATGSAIPSPSGGGSPDLVRSAAALRAAWLEAAARRPPTGAASISPEEIERRRRARLALTSGPLQVFAAEQLAACEAMALAVAADRPILGEDVSLVMARLDDARRASSHIIEQMLACERATMDLWRLLLSGDQA